MSTIADHIQAIELTGSEPQIKWARSLRAQKIQFFSSLGNQAVLHLIKHLMVEAEIRVMNAWTPERLGLLATYTVIKACSNPSARYWIDSRSEDPMDWLPDAWEAVRKHYLYHPFSDECP